MRLILCFLAVVLNSVCNADNTVGVQQTELATRKEIAVLMDRYRAVGLAVAVVRDAKLVYCDSFGFRDLEALNYNLIGTIIERVSGERFDQYVHHHLLEPPGLTGGFAVDALDASRFVTLYEYDADKQTLQSIVSQQGRYGLAIATTDQLIPGKTLKGHTGSAYGLYSMMFFSPEEKFGLVLITNGCDPKRSEGHIEFLKLSARSLYEQWIK